MAIEPQSPRHPKPMKRTWRQKMASDMSRWQFRKLIRYQRQQLHRSQCYEAKVGLHDQLQVIQYLLPPSASAPGAVVHQGWTGRMFPELTEPLTSNRYSAGSGSIPRGFSFQGILRGEQSEAFWSEVGSRLGFRSLCAEKAKFNTAAFL